MIGLLGIIYDMYRNDYDIDNEAPQTSSKTLYDSRFYVMNSEYRGIFVLIMDRTHHLQVDKNQL